MPDYPDILGYVTGQVRHKTNWAHLALAVRPRVARAGRPFEVLALVQNITDSHLSLTVNLQLHSQKSSASFIPIVDRFELMVRPAEVGYVTLPVNCAASTPAGDAYKLSIAFDVKSPGKSGQVRASEAEVEPEYLSESQLGQLRDLKKLSFSAIRRGLMGCVLEAPFSVLSGQGAAEADLRAKWVSLWKLSDHRDDIHLLRQYAGVLQSRVLPRLRREQLYPALYQSTIEHFGKAGYELQSAEAHYITKLLLVILEMAAPEEEAYDYLGAEHYNVSLALKRIGTAGEKTIIKLPSWCKGMLKQIEEQPAVAERPIALLAGALYDELIRDAMLHGIHMITRVTGESLGSDEDVRQYTEAWIGRLQTGEPVFSLADVYLPMVIGGAIVFERAITADEKVGERLTELSQVVKSRFNEVNDENELVYHMAEQVVDRALQKYGYRV